MSDQPEGSVFRNCIWLLVIALGLNAFCFALITAFVFLRT